MRLIDADELREKLFVFDMEFHDGHHQKYFVYKEKDVDSAPTIDPVKHEHWTRKRMLNHPLGTWKTLCMCSGCRHTQLTESAFCGGCGAKMDGDADE